MSVYVCVYRVIICTKIITFKYLFFFCYCLSDTFNLRNEFSLIAPVIDFYLNGTDCVSPLGIFILYTGNKLAFKCSVLFKFRSLSYSLCTSSYLAFDFFLSTNYITDLELQTVFSFVLYALGAHDILLKKNCFPVTVK